MVTRLGVHGITIRCARLGGGGGGVRSEADGPVNGVRGHNKNSGPSAKPSDPATGATLLPTLFGPLRLSGQFVSQRHKVTEMNENADRWVAQVGRLRESSPAVHQ